MSQLLESLPPRSFVDFTLPERSDGTELSMCREAGDFQTYVAWLADYLHMARLPLSPAQQAWLDSTPRSPQGVIFVCSDAYGYAEWDLAALNSWLESEGGHAEYHAEMHGLWLENTPPGEREEFPFEELSLATFERLRTEWLQEKAARVEWKHADIPYRPLLSWALQQIADPVARRNEVEWYFRNFTENASK